MSKTMQHRSKTNEQQQCKTLQGRKDDAPHEQKENGDTEDCRDQEIGSIGTFQGTSTEAEHKPARDCKEIE